MTYSQAHSVPWRLEARPMKIVLLALLGLVLGALGGAVLGIGAGLAWVEISETPSFEGYSGMLVFFTFMPLGAAIGGLGGALTFGLLAFRDAEIPIEREPRRPQKRELHGTAEIGRGAGRGRGEKSVGAASFK